MKYCPKCKQNKDESEFRPSISKKDGYQSYCRICDRESQRAWYQKNQDKTIARTRKRNERVRAIARETIIKELIGKQCAICGEKDILVLEYDHLGNKSFGIGDAKTLTRSEKDIRAEMSKCQILCSNCHRRKTHEESNSYRWRYTQELAKWLNRRIYTDA